MSCDVTVTGIGLVTPNGLNTDDVWSATLHGRHGLDRLQRFDPSQYPATVAGEVPDFVAEQHLPGRLIPQTDRMTRLALAAAEWSLRDAKAELDNLPEFTAGVVTAATAGGFEFGQRELENLWRNGPNHVSAYQSYAWFYAVNTGQISIRHGLKGPAGVLVSDHAGGLDAIAQGRRQVRKGLSLMIAGGADSTLCPWAWVAQLASNRISRAADPAAAYLPFDQRACGYVAGEGAAMLVLRPENETTPPAESYGRIAGYASTFDRRTEQGGTPALRKAVELALADAGLRGEDIDVVFADGAAIAHLDASETAVLTGLFGVRGVPVTVPKTMVGRLYSAGAALDVALALLSIRDGVIPPTVNVTPDRDSPLDLVVSEARPAPIRTALVLARGYGGFNSAMVITSMEV